jgi:hypothetical protein
VPAGGDALGVRDREPGADELAHRRDREAMRDHEPLSTALAAA